MNIWEWYLESVQEARVQGDPERQRLNELFLEGADLIDPNPDLALVRFAEGRALAQQLNEPWWALFFDHWRLQVLLDDKCDYQAALDLAVQSALEARKATFATFPQRVCLHEDLVMCYVGSDPWGHADAIREALTFMEAESDEDQECRLCIQGCATNFALDLGRLDEAEQTARRTLSMAEGSTFDSPSQALSSHGKLCTIAFRRKDWGMLYDHAKAGLDARYEDKRPRIRAELLVWMALLHRRTSDQRQAARLLRQAAQTVGRLGAVPYETYYLALSHYHEEAAEWEPALAARDRELEQISGKGMFKREIRCRMARCRYLSRLGRLTPADIEATRNVIARLKQPEAFLAELAGIGG